MTVDSNLAALVRRDGVSALSGYELTSLEEARLVSVSRQPGMDLNCTLARGNRLAPIVDVFPLTCTLLKDLLRDLLDELWARHRPGNYQLSGEEQAFTDFLQQKIQSGELNHAYVEEILGYELASWSLIQSLRFTSSANLNRADAEPFSLVHFHHDPRILLSALEADQNPPPDLPEGEYEVRITLRGDVLDVELETAQVLDCRSPAISPDV